MGQSVDTAFRQRDVIPEEECAHLLNAYALRPGRRPDTGFPDSRLGDLSSAGTRTARKAVAEASWPAREAVLETVLTNARVVLRDSVLNGSVHLVGDRIAHVDTGRSALSQALDLEGDLLIPGLVDIHTDNLERHLEPRPGVAWPNGAALIEHDRQVTAAGVTTVFDSLCVGDQRRGLARSPEALGHSLGALAWGRANGLLKAEHFMHLRCEVSADEVVETFAKLVDHPAVRLVSVMDHTPGQRQWRDVERWRKFNLLSHISAAELEAIYERRTHLGEGARAHARREITRMCRELGLVLASHDDTTPQHIDEAIGNGIKISEFPTTAVAARFARRAGMRVVMGAPNVVLGGSHSGNVSARELAHEGLVDALASDYVPVSLIQACMLLHQQMGLALPAAVAMVSDKPAAMIGLSDRGRVAPGLRADLVWVRAYDDIAVVRGVWRAGVRVV